MISPEDKNDTFEHSNIPTEIEPSVKSALDNISATEQMISSEMNTSGPELTAMLDEALVYIAEKTIEENPNVDSLSQEKKVNDAVNDVVVEGALEECGSQVSTEKNPIGTLEFDGFGNEITTAIDLFNQQDAKLPGERRSIAKLAVSVIDRVRSVPKSIMINRATKLIGDNTLYSDQKSGIINRYIDKKNIDVEDPRIQHALLKSLKQEIAYSIDINDSVEEHVKLGLKPETVLHDEIVKEAIIKKLSNLNERFYGPKYEVGDTLLSTIKECAHDNPELTKSDEFRNSIQELGDTCFNEALAETIYYYHDEETNKRLENKRKFIVDFLQPLGYELDKSKFFNIESGVVRSAEQQDRLDEAGLWTPDMTDYVYNMRLELVKKAQNENHVDAYNDKGLGFGAHIEISPNLEATETAAIYWQSQSKLIGTDAQMLVFNNIKLTECNAFGVSIEDYTRKFVKKNGREPFDYEIEDSQKKQLFNSDGLPLTDLFILQFDGLSRVINNYNYHEKADRKHSDSEEKNINKVMGFLSNNIDKLSEYDREYVKLWVNMPDELKIPLIQYASAGENMRSGMFDENGPTEKFYELAVTSEVALRVVSGIEDWKTHYSECEVSYINFIKSHADINIGVPFEDIANYFDSNGPTRNLYQKLFHDERNEGLKTLSSLENFEENLDTKQCAYLKLLRDNEYPFELSWFKDSLDEYFDDKGPTAALADAIYRQTYRIEPTAFIKKMTEIPELVSLCSPLRQKYLGFLEQSDFQRIVFELRPDTEPNEYFNETGATPKLWQSEFDNGCLDFILSRGEEEVAMMQLNEHQISVLKIYSEIRSNGINISEIENIDNEVLDTLLKMPDKLKMIIKWLNFPPELREMEKTGQFVINEKNILSYLCAYINLDANDWAVNGVSDIAKTFIKEAFEDTANKNMATDALQKYWKDYLKSDNPEAYPAALQLISQHNLDNAGAGQLSQVESFLNYMTAFQSHKDELFDPAKKIENRLKKERWDDSSISDFYNVSSEVITASPDIYNDFIEFFNGVSDKKDFDGFVKEIYPLYKAELTLQAKYTSGGWSADVASKASYSHLDIEKMRTNLNNTLLVYNLQELSTERRQDGIHRVREIILADIKELFSSKFSIVESAIPNEFSPADIRVMTDMAIYQSNLAHRSTERENLIGLFAALQLNKKGTQTVWDNLRQGSEINASDFLTSEKAKSINILLEKGRENDPINAISTGLNSETLTEFKTSLQQEVVSIRLGNVQTIDMRLSNLIGNIEELCDPDLYPEDIDKRRIRILGQFSAKTISTVSAKMYQSASGREINFSNEELSVRSKLVELLKDDNIEASTENIKKYLQDGFNLVKLPFNISQNIEDNHARDEIIKLQQMLSPSPEIMSIFNQIGEQFSTQSGTLALNADLDFLENLVVKREDDLSVEEKVTLRGYITLIREQMLKLEKIYDSTVTTFSKTEKSIHTASPELAAKTEQISRIINGTTDQKVITTVCSNQMTTIIENMRQCLSAKSAGINNDTDLTFGEGYKFYLYSHNETNPKGSISDEIIYLIPTENNNGERKLSFVMDILYGQKTSDVFLGHTETLIKKMKILHKKFPDANLSIFIPNNAIASASLNSELLAKNLGDSTIEILTMDDVKVTVPASTFGDHYIEFIDSPRATGEKIVSGTEIRIK